MLRLASKLLRWQSTTVGSGWVSGPAMAATAGERGNEQRHDATAPPAATDFARRAAHLKQRLRGRAQYGFAREEAQRFLDAEVPKADLGAWLDQGSNAVALANLLQFFEIQPEASVASVLLNRLYRVAEDTSVEKALRIKAARCLLIIRPEEAYERVLQVVAQVLQQTGTAPVSVPDFGTARMDDDQFKASMRTLHNVWEPLADCAKVLHRCGKRVPPTLNDELARVIMENLQVTQPNNFRFMQDTLLRVYGWMVRAERPESNQLLYVLIEHTGDFKKDGFATLLLSCVRHNQLAPLPVELVQRLAREASFFRTTCNAREAANILGSLAKLLSSLAPGANGVSLADLYRVQDYYSALLEEFRLRIVRFMDPADTFYCVSAVDVSTIAFAYELGGHIRYRVVFERYGAYVLENVQAFEPPQLALATGILRRAQLLTPTLAARLSERIEVVLGELRLPELSHICATFAVLPMPKPTWWEEAKAVAQRLYTQKASGVVQLNLAIAFHDVPNLVDIVDYAQITSKQLVDVLPITLGSARFEEPVVTALCTRLATAGERFTSDELRVLLSCGRSTLAQAAQAHLHRAFAESEWNSDTLFSMPLVCDAQNPERNLQTLSVAKALAAAKAASVGPQQFVTLSELLVTTFGDSDGAVRQYVEDGGADLVKEDRVPRVALLRYLGVVRRYPSIVLSTEWLRSFAEKEQMYQPLGKSDFEDLLLSLRSIYEDVAKTPALQTLLSVLVETSYVTLTDADEQTARVTVLLVYLQSGMTLPLLTAKHPILVNVMQKESTFSPQVRKALAMMPMPRAAPSADRRGRFVLKRLDAPHGSGDPSALAFDLNTSDPFEVPFEPSVAASSSPPLSMETKATAPTTPNAPAAASSSLPPSPPIESDASAASLKVEATAPAAAEEKPMSYYAKFFSTSVGQIFTGRGIHDKAERETKEEEGEGRAAPPASTEDPQPRRTRLHPSTHGAASPPLSAASPASAAAAALNNASPSPVETTSSIRPPMAATSSSTPPAAPLASTVSATPTAVPVTSFTTAWGTAPSMSGWGFAAATMPPPPSSASSSSAAAAAVEQQHNTAFSSLFGSPPAAASSATIPAAAAPPPPPAATPASAPLVSSPAQATLRPTGMGGNNVFFDPSNPSAQRSRPVISRKAVITRSGVTSSHGLANPSTAAASASAPSQHANGMAATPEQDEIRRIYNDPARATEVHTGVGSAGGPQIVLDARAAPAAAPFRSGSNMGNHGNSSSGVPLGASTNTSGNVSGMAQFMQKTGVTKITGYNMDEEAANATEDVTAAGAAAAAGGTGGEGRPALDWMDAARRVARVTRHPRTKAKSRAHTSLSAWLSTPSARLDAAAPEDAPAAAAAAPAPSAAADDVKKVEAAPARQTTVAAALHRRRTKKEKAAAAAAAAAAKAAATPAEPAEAPVQSSSSSSKRGAGGGGGRGKAAKAATGKAAKPTKPAKAPAKPAAAVKRKAPAKKAAATTKAAKPAAAAKAAGGGRAKRAAPAAAARPSVKSAKKTVKAAAKKAAPAKKKAAPAGRAKKK